MKVLVLAATGGTGRLIARFRTAERPLHLDRKKGDCFEYWI
jgi:hypothetical protein